MLRGERKRALSASLNAIKLRILSRRSSKCTQTQYFVIHVDDRYIDPHVLKS